jgi:hypothetical protein
MLATLDQELRSPKLRDLDRALRAPRHAPRHAPRGVRCGGIGRSCLGVNTFSVDSSPLSPSAITSATLRFWYDQSSYTIGGTPVAGGTSPPVVTFTGTLKQPLGILVTTSDGARGVATYSVWLNNGVGPAYQTGTTAATVLISGTGITINFPSGTYHANNTYKAIASVVVDKVVPATNDLANVTAGQRPQIIVAGPGGLQTMRYNGTSDRHFNTTSGVWNTVFGGLNSPFTVIWIGGIVINQVGTTAFWCAGNTTDANLPNVTLKKNGVNSYQITRRATAGVISTIDSLAFPNVGPKVIIWRFDGVESRLRVNGLDIIGGESMVPGTNSIANSLTLNQMCVSAIKTTATGNFANNDMSEFVGFQGAVADDELFRLENYFLN